MKSAVQDQPITVYTSADLNGLTGDNGETVCVFIHNYRNPLSSAWAWFNTIDEANMFIEKLRS